MATVMLLSFAGCESLRDSGRDGRQKFLTALGQYQPNPTAKSQPENSQGLSFARIKPGSFLMGSKDGGAYGRYSECEVPQHRVTLTKPFWMSRYEVTVRQFAEFVNSTGYVTDAEKDGQGCNGLVLISGAVKKDPQWIWSSPGFEQTDNHPVVCVSWNDANAYCKWLSEENQRTFRLPTEAEWEYVCRAGRADLFCSGSTSEDLAVVANAADQSLQNIFPLAQGCGIHEDGFPFTAPVGSFSPNAWGVFDMHGNVGEWCQDWFSETAYARHSEQDPTGPSAPTLWRVVRGGSWYNSAASCRCACRHDGIETMRSTTNGFRVVCE